MEHGRIYDQLTDISEKLTNLLADHAVMKDKLIRLDDLDARVSELEKIKERGVGFKIAMTFLGGIISFGLVTAGAMYEYAKTIPTKAQADQIHQLQSKLDNSSVR